MLTLFSWLTNLGTLSVLLLMATASFAVIRFFMKKNEPIRLLAHVVLPFVSGVAPLVVVALAVVHFDVLTRTSGTLAWALPLIIPLAAACGLVLPAFRASAPEKDHY